MASTSKIPALLFILIVFVDLLSLAGSSPQANIHQDSPKGPFRVRRATCIDGTYYHNGKQCCNCAAGQQVKEHCSMDLTYGQCEFCETGTYSSHPNSQTTCELCRSCDQPNANLEVDQPCTIANNTKCRCKKDHYCDAEICKVCHPCTTCDFGIDKACTLTSDTVCKQENNNTSITVGVLVSILVVVVVVIGGILAYVWRKRQRKGRGQPETTVSQPLTDVPDISPDDFQPLLLDISEELGWSVVKEVAIYSKIKNTVIESCERNHPNDNQEQTAELLRRWAEIQGRKAPKELVRILEARGRNAKAEKVREILLASVAV